MNTLKIPDAGVRMDGPGANDSAYPTQAFPILLNDAVIEGMVKCVRNGGKIELNLGSNPVRWTSPQSIRADHCLSKAFRRHARQSCRPSY